jgi:hypothetical protein
MLSMAIEKLRRISFAIVRWHTGWVWSAMFAIATGAAWANKFGLVYLSLAVLAIYSVGFWLCSEKLEQKRPGAALLHLPDGSKVWDLGPFRRWQMIPSLLITGAFILAALYVRSLQIEFELQALEGWLYPANESIESPCPLNQPNDLVLMSGTNAYAADKFPYNALTVNCDRVMLIDKDVNGRVGLTLSVLDQDGRVVVDIEKGHFKVNKNNYFAIDRHHSRSTLSVIDQFKHEVLYLHLANKNVLQMRASFYHRGIPIRIDDLHPFGASRIVATRTCIAHGGGAVQLGDCRFR